MTFPAAPVRLVLAAAVFTALAVPVPAFAQAGVVALASHRAVYDSSFRAPAASAR